jgi:hypothetical protein
MTIKRICLTPTDPKNYDKDYNITVDLNLSETGIPTERSTALGVRGSLKKDSNNETFLFFKDGWGDFGSGFEEGRDFHLNLRGAGRSVAVGEFFTYKDDSEEITYKVTQVINLQ